MTKFILHKGKGGGDEGDDIFEKELALCKKLSGENRGGCNWGRCRDCGVVPFLYKLYKEEIIEDVKTVKKIKKELFK